MHNKTALAMACWATVALALSACIPKETGLPTLTPTPSRATIPTRTSTPSPPVVPTPTEPAPTPSSTPIVYVVRSGDSLSGIAFQFDIPIEDLAKANQIEDPNLIREGQRLVIPGPTPLPTATVLPTETPTVDIPPQIEIVDVIGRGAPSTETVIIANRGRPLSLYLWTLRDAQGNAFVFPNIYLAQGTELRVHTGVGEDTPLHLYWNRDEAVWDEAGDTAILADEQAVLYASKSLE
ncbi:MAG: LysM peptidoglycan-binding domain-containing protein [Anaerolineae bacterium]|nr:LysM peptidoglycan-binding domain-containing protein [Anaerolineae bacterium]